MKQPKDKPTPDQSGPYFPRPTWGNVSHRRPRPQARWLRVPVAELRAMPPAAQCFRLSVAKCYPCRQRVPAGPNTSTVVCDAVLTLGAYVVQSRVEKGPDGHVFAMDQDALERIFLEESCPAKGVEAMDGLYSSGLLSEALHLVRSAFVREQGRLYAQQGGRN